MHYQEKCTNILVDYFVYGIHLILGVIQNTIGGTCIPTY